MDKKIMLITAIAVITVVAIAIVMMQLSNSQTNCGNGTCDVSSGETKANCPVDCPPTLSELCSNSQYFTTRAPYVGVTSNLTKLTEESQNKLNSEVQRSGNTALEGIKDLTCLEHFGIVYLASKVTNISALSGLKNLRQLWLGDTSVSDFSPLSGNANLEELSITRTQYLTDLSPLISIKNLISLQIGGQAYDQKITNISFLTSLTKLERLQIFDISYLTDFAPISKLTNLKVLSLYETNFSDTGLLSGLTKLEELDLSSTEITDIAGLSTLTNLTKLDLVHTKITNVSVLSGLTKLADLSLSNTQVSNISALANLVGLERLSLSPGKISDFSPLYGLSNLKIVYIPGLQNPECSEVKEKLPEAEIRCEIPAGV